MLEHLRQDEETGHYIAAYALCGRTHELDLTTYLQVGEWSETAEVNPDALLRALTNCGPLRYTVFQAWCEAKQFLEHLERDYEIWWSGKYSAAEGVLQREKEAGVLAKTRSVGENITEARIKTRIILDNPDEYREWHDRLEGAKGYERRIDGLYHAIDIRGKELSTIVTNLGYLNRKP